MFPFQLTDLPEGERTAVLEQLDLDSQEMRDFLGMKDKEDRVLGAFLMGKVQEGKTFKGKRRDWMEKVTWK